MVDYILFNFFWDREILIIVIRFMKMDGLSFSNIHPNVHTHMKLCA